MSNSLSNSLNLCDGVEQCIRIPVPSLLLNVINHYILWMRVHVMLSQVDEVEGVTNSSRTPTLRGDVTAGATELVKLLVTDSSDSDISAREQCPPQLSSVTSAFERWR